MKGRQGRRWVDTKSLKSVYQFMFDLCRKNTIYVEGRQGRHFRINNSLIYYINIILYYIYNNTVYGEMARVTAISKKVSTGSCFLIQNPFKLPVLVVDTWVGKKSVYRGVGHA